MKKKKTIAPKKISPAKAVKTPVKKTSSKPVNLPNSTLTVKQKKMMYSYFERLKELLSDYDPKDDYTFDLFGNDDKVGKKAREDMVAIHELALFIFGDLSTKDFKITAKMLDVNEKNLRHFLDRKI